jgi:DNA-binding XRE family transcriptional regulator
MKIEIECKLKEIMKMQRVYGIKLAEKTGLRRETISMIANGKKCNLETALLISEALDITVNEIWVIKKEM